LEGILKKFIRMPLELVKKDTKDFVDLVAGTKINKDSAAFHLLKSGFLWNLESIQTLFIIFVNTLRIGIWI
ncbi:hypothetical protein, partial [Anaerotignum sp.]|uniref:hypothetical protein n=1 Tax=Anaerotignum sp. TaxID=2039241 RepID=UPI0027154112